MMFTIDLLKGQGKPKVKQRGTLLLVAMALVVPVLIFLLMTGQYVSASIDLPIQQSTLDKLKNKDSDQVAPVKNEIDLCKSYLKEVKDIVSGQVQWSNILVQLVENLPDTLIIDSLKTSENSYSVEQTSKTDPNKKIKVKKTRYIANMRIIADLDDVTFDAIQEYVKKLSSLGMATIIKNQGTASVKNKEVMVYQVESVIEK